MNFMVYLLYQSLMKEFFTMNNYRSFTLNTNQNIIVDFTDERIIPDSGLAVVDALFGKNNFFQKLNRMDVTKNCSQHQIKNGYIIPLTLVCSAWENHILRQYTKWMMIKHFTRQRLALPRAFHPKKLCVSA